MTWSVHEGQYGVFLECVSYAHPKFLSILSDFVFISVGGRSIKNNQTKTVNFITFEEIAWVKIKRQMEILVNLQNKKLLKVQLSKYSLPVFQI